MKVCLFGSYVKDSHGIPSGNGGELLKKILQTQNVEVIECREPIRNLRRAVSAYFKLIFKHRKLNYDVVIIPWRGLLTLPLAKLICKKPIIFFPAFSVYDTLVNDRKRIKKNSIQAKIIHLVEKIACRWSNIIVLESSAEIDYFENEFNINRKKFRQLNLSADETFFHSLPIKKRENNFIIFFFGTFIPLHGVEVMVESAKLLHNYDEIKFVICGDGQTKPEIESFIKKNELQNVELLGLVSKEKLRENLQNSDICLGIFGKTLKSKKVLTNKVYQILASQKPLITMDSPAAQESHLTDKKNCILIPPNDPKKLAESILYLKNNPEISNEIAKEGRKTFEKFLSLQYTGKKLLGYLQEELNE